MTGKGATMSESRASYFREYRAKRAASRAEGSLMPFQSRLSCRRFAGRKTRLISLRFLSHAGTARAWLCGKIVARSV